MSAHKKETSSERKHLVIVNFGELILKGKNRNFFEERLISNIRASLRGISFERLENLQSRVAIYFEDVPAVKEALDKLRRVFGVISLAGAASVSPTLADIESAVISGLRDRQAKTFAIRAKRIEKSVPFSSKEVNEKVGSQVNKLTGWQVNLDEPDITSWIDIYNDKALVYSEKIRGAGGLPSLTSGRVACLISGGIDSPVAAWRMMKRGCEVDFVHFHSAPFTDRASIEKVEEIVELLKTWQCGKGRLIMVPLGGLQKKIVTNTNEKYRVVLYRRFMVRIACEAAKRIGAMALVTGESLGQVASQTLSNLSTVDSVAGLPILRPLIGMDKQEIVDTAREIGTYETSILPHKDCCQFLEPRHPVTYTTCAELEEVEKGLDVDELVKEGLTGVETCDN